MATKRRTKKAPDTETTTDTEKMSPEEYRAYLAKINREAPNELERRRSIGEIIKKNAEKRDVGDFDSTKVLRLMRDGKLDY